MTCIEYEMLILDKKEGIITKEQFLLLDTHMKTCTACKQFEKDIDMQDNLFQQLPAGIVPPVSAVDAVMNRIVHDLSNTPQGTQSHSVNSAVKASKVIAKITHVVKTNLFIVISTGTIVTAGAITGYVVLNNSSEAPIPFSSPSPAYFVSPKSSESASAQPGQVSAEPSENPTPSSGETLIPTLVPSYTPVNSGTPKPTEVPSEAPTPTPTSSSTPKPSPSPSFSPSATTFVNANIEALKLAWKIPNLDDTKVIYIYKQGAQDSSITVEIANGPYHVQDPDKVYMVGTGAPIRVLQFYDDQFIQLEIEYNNQQIQIWVDLEVQITQIYGKQ